MEPGRQFAVGDKVRRSASGKAVYEVKQIEPGEGGRVALTKVGGKSGCWYHSGEIAKFVKHEEA